MASLLLGVITVFSVHLPTADAAFSQADINEQKRAVLLELVDTMEEQLNLLQMLYINRLEAQVQYLQAIADTQS